MDVAIDLFAEDGRPRPLGALALDDGAAIITSSVVLELKTTGGILTATPVIGSASSFGDGPGGPWIAEGAFDGTELYIRRSGEWLVDTVEVSDVVAIREDRGVLTAVARSGARLQIVRRDRDGEWLLVGPLSTDVVFAMPVDGGFLAMLIPEEGKDVHRAAVSADGQTWEPIGGWGFELDPTPVLRSLDDPSVVALAADWPDLRPVELPDPAASPVEVRGEVVAARTSTDLYVFDGGERSAVPLDVEHGITGEVIVIPGGTPRVAMFDRGRMQILTWRDVRHMGEIRGGIELSVR